MYKKGEIIWVDRVCASEYIPYYQTTEQFVAMRGMEENQLWATDEQGNMPRDFRFYSPPCNDIEASWTEHGHTERGYWPRKILLTYRVSPFPAVVLGWKWRSIGYVYQTYEMEDKFYQQVIHNYFATQGRKKVMVVSPVGGDRFSGLREVLMEELDAKPKEDSDQQGTLV